MTDVLRLFLIEDEPEMAFLIRKCLERVGHQVTCCRTGADALIVLGHTAFDLVLLDQHLPDMSGLDLLHTLTREGVSAPVLMVTVSGHDAPLAASVLRAGALDYIVKDQGLAFLADLPKRVVELVKRHRLEQMNRLLIQALESARDGVAITDLQGTILNVNQALEQMTGYSRQELLGQTPRLFKSGAHPPEFYSVLWRTILGRDSWQDELTNRRKDGGLYQASATISPIVDPQGRMTHFVGIYRDVTEHKKLERQLLQAQKMQSVGTLAGGVAHEFNNLLAGINGYASLALRESEAGPTVREFLQNVVDLSERAAALTRQLLAFARKPALSRQPTSIPDLVRGTAELVTRTLHQEVALEIEGGPADAPLVVEADVNQLQQALVNLTLNARDALTERGTGREPAPEADAPRSPRDAQIVFRLRRDEPTHARAAFPHAVPPGDYVLLQVEDCGAGMSPEVLNQALDPFFTTKEVGQGTGLGLPMVFGIVQGHQGFLTIDSVPGQGTCVSIYLPRLVPDPGAGRRAPSPHQPDVVVAPESAPGRSILVVDDEEAVLDVVRRFLEIAGHKVSVASSGHAALELLADGRPVDLVMLDLMMPREDAAETFLSLRQRRPDVPVMLCTGLAGALPAPEALLNSAVGIIRKPFRMNELWYAVRRALDRTSEDSGSQLPTS